LIVVDASALLAFLLGERGEDVVERALITGATCSTVNWSEVAQKARAAGRDWQVASQLLRSYDLRLEPVSAEDAEAAAEMWEPRTGLSLADRLCLALAERLDVAVLTADRSWGESGRVRQIR
jgi:PIN domain nuclease of toxin-antitoxin system